MDNGSGPGGAREPFAPRVALLLGLALGTREDWDAYCRGARADLPPRDPRVPEEPELVYGRGWRGWEDWLGATRRCEADGRWRSFEEARAFVRTLGLKGQREWAAYCRGRLEDSLGRKPDDVPACPADVYHARGWAGTGDWLGTDRVHVSEVQWLPFVAARDFARGLGLDSCGAWRAYCRGERSELPTRPADVPACPDRTYRAAWRGWGDWLGTGRPRNNRAWRPFAAARAFVRALGLRNQREWCAYSRGDLVAEKGARPSDIPGDPATYYAAHGWQGLGDFLGTGNVRQDRKEFRSFDEARAFVRSRGLFTLRDWQAYCRGDLPELGSRPADIPTNPDRIYRDAWQGWRDFLGSEHLPRRRRSRRGFEDARAFVRTLGLKSAREWVAFCRGELPDRGSRPLDIPATPDRAYQREGHWQGWRDFLGTE